MSEPTKACNLTEDEVGQLIIYHGTFLHDKTEMHIERINYLHRRLKAFKDELPEAVASNAGAAGWSSTNG